MGSGWPSDLILWSLETGRCVSGGQGLRPKTEVQREVLFLAGGDGAGGA